MDESGEGEALPRALLVDDEKEVADAYALRLRGLCEIETVYHGEDALVAAGERQFDVVLLDRHMPGLSGDEVLTKLNERGFDGRVIMVTAIDPGFDVLDMPFDDYLCKPIEREDIRAAVTQQCTILGYETLGEYFSVESRRSVIEAEVPADERDDHEAYQETSGRADRLRARAERLLDDADELFAAFEDIERESRQ
jgi:DNA-binding response OmpR family regulator